MTPAPVKISIIVPVYHVAAYLRPCLLSCTGQTLPDIEIICINDGSTDNSQHILNEFLVRDPRIIVINQAHRGVSAARNAGLDRASGEVVMFLDADDYLEETACARVWQEMHEAPTDICIFSADTIPQTPAAPVWYQKVLTASARRCDSFSPEVLFDVDCTRPFLWHQAFARKLLQENRIRFDENISLGEDQLFLMSTYPHAAHFSFIPDLLYHYRWSRSGSVMETVDLDMDSKLAKHLTLVEKATALWDKKGWLQEYGREYLTWLLEFMIPDITKDTVRNPELLLQELRHILVRYGLNVHLDLLSGSARAYADSLGDCAVREKNASEGCNMIGLPVKVSIIVPVYNVETYLSTCLLSCINQTLFDIEILCVNDGSTDHSLEILEEFAKTDYRIKIINKENGGLSSARNAGLDHANGQMIMFLDSDDYLAPNACERVWQETMEAPTDIVIFGTNIFPEIPAASGWYYETLHLCSRRYSEFSGEVLFQERGAKPFVWRQAFSKLLLDTHGLRFDEAVRYGEDMVFQMQTFPHAENFSFIEDRLYHYRWFREGSLMQSYRTNLDEKIQKHLSLIEIISRYWNAQGWLELYSQDYTNWLLEFIVYDTHDKDCLTPSVHLAALNAHIREYGLDSFLKTVPGTIRHLSKRVMRARS